MYLRQATTGAVILGPYLSASDGVTAQTALTITDAQVQLIKADNSPVQKNDATDLVHTSGGWYKCTLDATDTNTVGSLIIQTQDSATYLPVWREFYVLDENAYDGMFGEMTGSDGGFGSGGRVSIGYVSQNSIPQSAGYMGVNVLRWGGTENVFETGAGLPTVNVRAIDASTSAATSLKNNIANLDTTVSSRSSHSAADVWSAVTRTLTSFTFEVNSNLVQVSGNNAVVASLISNIGNLDTTVSSRSSHSAADVWAVGTRELTAFSFTVFANLVQISGDNAPVGNFADDYDGTGYNKSNSTVGTVTNVTNTVTSNLVQISGNNSPVASLSSNIGNLDAAVSTRSSHSAADVWAVGSRTLTDFGFTVFANLVQISGNNIPVANLASDYDGSGYAKTNSTIGTVTNITNAVSGNVIQWDGHSVITVGGYPSIDVFSWAGTAVSNSGGLPNVNVEAIDTNDASATALNTNISNLDTTISSRSSHAAADIWSVGSRELTAIQSGILTTSAINHIADLILSRGVENVENSANLYSLARVILASTNWEMVGQTGLRIKRTDGSEFDIVAISGDANANLIVTVG